MHPINLIINELAPTRAHRLCWVVVNLAAFILAFVPLFNLLGYESAAFFGVLLGLIVTGLTVYTVRSGPVKAPLDASRRRAPASDFGRLAMAHLALSVGPMLILTLNGLRVPNCDWGAGFLFWALIVLPAILLGQAAAWVAVSIVPERRIGSWLVAFSFPIADGLALIHHLAMQPPIIGHQWFLGYFGGSIYDEGLAVPLSLIAYRALHMLAIIAVVAAIQALYELRRHRVAGWTILLALSASMAFVIGFGQRTQAGISIDRDHIVEELGGRVETEHFVIYYPKTRHNLDRLDEIIDDHEFRYHQLRRFFDVDPVAESGRKVRSFVYGNRNQKGRLMGGKDTMVAKLWLHEMHILWSGLGDPMLTHELAHIFTEPFGGGPLRLSMQWGVGVNMGLVEGIATAADWRSRELTPHEASAAMRQLDIAPDLRQILGARGFWSEASGTAYTAMGSFVRYLVDERGIEAFKTAYPHGDFVAGYGVEVEELISDWEQFVDTIELSERQMDVAQYRYDRSSIFGRDCARALAEERDQARSAAASGALGRARSHYERYLRDDPHHENVLRAYARVLAELELIDEALEVVENRPSEKLSASGEARFLDLKGDLLWTRGDERDAVKAYEQALDKGVYVNWERSLHMKSMLARRGEQRGRQILVDGLDDIGVMVRLMSWRYEDPQDPAAAYLLGRKLWQSRDYENAISHLQSSQGNMGAEVLDAEASLMLGHSYYVLDRLDESEEIWTELADSSITRYREAARQWLKRLEWARGNSH